MPRSSGVNVKASALYPQFTPGVSAGATSYYTNPLATSFASFTKAIGIAGFVPYFSGSKGLTIDTWDVDILTVSTGGTIYAAAYTIVNQAQPFNYHTGVANYATFLAAAGSVISTGLGRVIGTATPNVVVPPNTWFLFGGYQDVSAAATNAGQAVAGAFSPYGRFNGGAASLSIPCINIDLPGQSGGSFAAAIGDSAGNQGRADLGIGIHILTGTL